MASNSPPSAPSSLEKVIRKYIPKELIPDTWKCNKKRPEDNLQHLLTQGDNPQLGMFESAEELLTQINLYINFPRSMQYFDMDPLDRIEPKPYLHISLKNNTFIYEKDLFKIFNCSPFDGEKHSEVMNKLNAYWKATTDDNDHKMVFYPYILAKPDVSNQRVCAPLSNALCKAFNNEWEEYVKKEKNKDTNAELNEYFTYTRSMADWIELIKRNFNHLVDNGFINLPQLNLFPPIDFKKPRIRVFSFDEHRFVVVKEFIQILAAYQMDWSTYLERNAEDVRTLSTFSFDKISKKICQDPENQLEFVILEIPKLMFSQTPIPTWDKGYCILAADALYELLMDLIVAKKVFHISEVDIFEKIWIHVKKVFDALKFYFDSTSEQINFLHLKDVDAIKTMWKHVYNTHLKRYYPNVKHFKKPSQTAFSLAGLVETLESLGLEKSCKGIITKYAKPVYMQFETETEDGLSLSQLHVAITRCEINWVVGKMPKISEFIHNQKSCNRMNIVGCKSCLSEK